MHAHPPTATGFAASGLGLSSPLVCEVVVGLGSIPLARYGTPGTPELTDALEPLIPNHDAILMANHGVVTYGPSLESAFMKMETVEHFAKIALVTHMLGQAQPLGEKEVEKLHEVRQRYNYSSAARRPIAGDGLEAARESEETAAAARYGTTNFPRRQSANPFGDLKARPRSCPPRLPTFTLLRQYGSGSPPGSSPSMPDNRRLRCSAG